MFRISTGNGVVDVTEDHSLLSPELDILKPRRVICDKGETLEELIDDHTKSVDELWREQRKVKTAVFDY